MFKINMKYQFLYFFLLITEPVEIFRIPMTTTQGIAAWRKDEPLKQREPWTTVPRFSHVNSEMTK